MLVLARFAAATIIPPKLTAPELKKNQQFRIEKKQDYGETNEKNLKNTQ